MGFVEMTFELGHLDELPPPVRALYSLTDDLWNLEVDRSGGIVMTSARSKEKVLSNGFVFTGTPDLGEDLFDEAEEETDDTDKNGDTLADVSDEADSSDSDFEIEQDPIGEEPRILLGPSLSATAPFEAQELDMHGAKLRSGPNCLALSDIYALNTAKDAPGSRRQGEPLSFGSVVHVLFGSRRYCRPCMFDRPPSVCNRKWLCDFCHVHYDEGKKFRARTRIVTNKLNGDGLLSSSGVDGGKASSRLKDSKSTRFMLRSC